MEEAKFTVKALAAFCGCSIRELAEKACIKPEHLYKVSRGSARMLGTDLKKLAEVTGVPEARIKWED